MHQNATIRLAGADLVGDFLGPVGIIHGLLAGKSADVLHLVPHLFDEFLQFVFQRKTRVIRSYRHPHVDSSLRP